MSKSRRVVFAVLSVALVGMLIAPSIAEAQRRGRGFRGPAFGSQVGWGQYGPWGRARYPYPYGYRNEFNASIRVQVEPRNAEVFVDGAFAGLVDDFDSWYQRLWVRPGNHEIAIYLEGFRTARHVLYLAPGAAQHIKQPLEPLKAGESSGPRPQPARGVEPEPRPGDQPRPPRTGDAPAQAPAPPERFGTLAVRVQPEGAEVLIDGKRWTGKLNAIQLSVGRHRVEVRLAGFQTYTEDVLIRTDRTLSLEVTLKK